MPTKNILSFLVCLFVKLHIDVVVCYVCWCIVLLIACGRLSLVAASKWYNSILLKEGARYYENDTTMRMTIWTTRRLVRHKKKPLPVPLLLPYHYETN